MHVLRSVLTSLAMLVAVVACRPASSTITVGPDGLRTFSVPDSINGHPVLCTASAAIHPLVGTLASGAGGREPVWLTDPDGRAVSVVWPEGFTVRFEPVAALYDDRGARVAQDGDRIELAQVDRDGHAGTYDDPFVASGLVFNGCYPFVR